MANLSPQQATRQAMSAQWALTQLGAQNYLNLCQRFIENAYGTSGRYGSAAQASNALMNNTNMADADVGDLVFFRPDRSNGGAGHVGIYLGNGEMVSATNGGITRDRLDSPYWSNLLVGFGDPPDQWAGRSDNALVQGAADLVAKGAIAVGDTARAAAASPIGKWGGAGKWINQIAAAAEKYNVPINLVAATMNAESGGNPTARSPAGAVGLMQLMPGTARGLGAADPTDPDQNIDAGVRYMSQLYDQFGDWGKVTQAYNAGPNGNWDNAETRNHLKKVMANANEIGGSIQSGGSSGGGGMPTGGGSGFGEDWRRGQPPQQGQQGQRGGTPPNIQAATDFLGRLWQDFQSKFGTPSSPGGGMQAPNIFGGGQGPLSSIPSSGAPAGPPPPGLPPGAPPSGAWNPGGSSDPASGTVGGGTNATGALGPTVTATGATAGAAGNPPGYIDPATMPEAYRGMIEANNELLRQMADAQATMKSAAPDSDAYYTAQKRYNDLLQRWGQMAPTIANITTSVQKSRQGEFVPGTSAGQKKWTIVKQDPVTGAITTEVIDNPNPQDSDSLLASRESAAASRYGSDISRQNALTAAEASRYGSDVARQNALTSAESAANVARINQETQLGTSINQTNASRATAALQAAIQDQQTRLDAQIRAGDLSLREATEKWNQWYKTNVEAPLAVLQQQRETERYRIEGQNAITQRATAQAEHERGVANIGQQMWQGAAQAYNQMIPLTVGEGWGQGFQQNLTGQGYTPNQGATYNTPESLDQFATRKVAEMLKGVSPYAASIANAQGQIGNPGQAMSGDQMTGLMNTATNVAQNALSNPMQMPNMAPITMPGPINIPGMATAGAGNAMGAGDISQYLPDYSQQHPVPQQNLWG